MFAEGWLESLPGILTVTFLFGGWIIVAVVSSLAKSWRKIHESEHLAALKQGMIERGMSADEIERVLRAAPESAEDSPGDDAATELATKLAEHGVPAPALEQILTTFRAASPGARKPLVKTVVAMLDNGAESDQVIAAVRALGPGTPSQPAAPGNVRYTDDPASFRH